MDLTLDSIGRHKMRSGGEEHRYNPATIHMLQKSTRMGDYGMFKEYTKMVDEERSGNLRSLMDFNFPEKGIPIEEVESVEDIVKRFKTGAMSYGSISQEAHETLAIAMNMLHGKSTPVRVEKVKNVWILQGLLWTDVLPSNRWPAPVSALPAGIW